MPDALLPTSGASSFNPSFGDLALDAFSRCLIRPPALTYDHWFQARLSANLMQSEWSNVGMPLLWKQTLVPISLQPGVSLYTLPSNVVAALDAYIRVYQTGNAQSFTPIFITQAGSLTVTVTQPLHGYAAGQMVWYPIPVSASSIILQGPILIDAVVDPNTYTITAPTFPDGTSSASLPQITSTAGSSIFSVFFRNHGLSAGQNFYVNVPTTVGGAQLSGGLPVTAVIDQNTFTIQGSQAASSTGFAMMNGGLMQAQSESFGVDPIDFILYPISRTEYAAQPDKGPNLQFRPTTFWYLRTQPQQQIQFWNPPDNNGPYIFFLWAITQQFDAAVAGGVGVDVPYRFYEAWASGLAAKLAEKFPEELNKVGRTPEMLATRADNSLMAALKEDIERVPLFIQPGTWSYYR